MKQSRRFASSTTVHSTRQELAHHRQAMGSELLFHGMHRRSLGHVVTLLLCVMPHVFYTTYRKIQNDNLCERYKFAGRHGPWLECVILCDVEDK